MRSLCGLAALVLVAVGTHAQQGAGAQVPRSGPAGDANQAIVDRYCVTCHNQRLKTANLQLDTLDLRHPEKDALV